MARTCTQYNKELQAILDRTLNFSNNWSFPIATKRAEQLYKRLASRVGYIPDISYVRLSKYSIRYNTKRFK